MKSFSFKGEIPASKSLLNRALLSQSYFPQIKISGNSHCDDVRHMKMAIAAMIQKKEIDCGEAGTVFRFMALRASRNPGVSVLTGSERLFSRPHADLYFLLEQLSVKNHVQGNKLIINSEGWKKPLVPLQVRREASSQFASGLILNSWNLPFDLEFEMKSGISEGYWEMSVRMAELLGMNLQKQEDRYRIPTNQAAHYFNLAIEPDYSSAFAVAAAGALSGQAVIENFTEESLQPDFCFVEILKKMGVAVTSAKSDTGLTLTFVKPKELAPIEMDLSNSPDLFPVLAVLCAFAKGKSKLFGAPQLAHKESNRIEKTSELLRAAGFVCQIKNDGLLISGEGLGAHIGEINFNPDQDHRMAMAAGLIKLKGFKGKIATPEVVSKSYPEFWKVLGVHP